MAGRPPNPEKTHQLLIKMPESKFLEIQEKARRLGLSANAYFKMIGFQALEKESKNAA